MQKNPTYISSFFGSKVDTDHLKVCSNSLISPVSLYVDKYSGFQTNQDIESGFRFVFSGNLGYFPNRYSLELILNEIWPSLRAEYPKCKLFVVGRSASQELISMLVDTESVEYIGEVDDIKKELVKYHFALCPMYAGSGMQLKMLEAMALGLPVITNKLGIGDIKNIGQAYVTETVGDLLVLLSSHNQERHRVMANLARRVIDLEYSQIKNDEKYLEYIGAK
jgi:glycosyltransferase involved in cell wall biosynthesis